MHRPPETAMMSGKGLYFPPQHASINFASSVYLLELGIRNTDGKGFVAIFSSTFLRLFSCHYQDHQMPEFASLLEIVCLYGHVQVFHMNNTKNGICCIWTCEPVNGCKGCFLILHRKVALDIYKFVETSKPWTKPLQSLECLCIGHSRLSVSCCCSLCGWSS